MENALHPTVRRLENPSDAVILQAAYALQAAFDKDDPFLNIFVGGNHSLIPLHFESLIRDGLLGGEVHVATLHPDTDEIVGVAVWYGPGKGRGATEEQRQVLSEVFLSQCPEELRTWRYEHFLPNMDRLAIESLGSGFHKAQWSLLLIGVLPEHHRKGIAKSMIKVIEERARLDGVSIVLETTTELDLVIYQRIGFEVKGQITVASPVGQTPVYQLIKTPT